MGEWCAVGVDEGSIVKRMGGPSMRGRVWCSHVLNLLERYSAKMWSCSFSLLASVAGNGRQEGRVGGVVLLGYWH